MVVGGIRGGLGGRLGGKHALQNPADFDRMNVNGSGISLGHPVGATGARMLATLLREMARRGVRFGLETMCIGGGQGLFAKLPAPLRLDLVEARSFDCGVVVHIYRPRAGS